MPSHEFQDILPKDHTYTTFLKKVIRHRMRQGGFQRITTARIEPKKIFIEANKEADPEIASKLIPCGENGDLTLPYQKSPSILRSYMDHDMQRLPQPVKHYYLGSSYEKDETARLGIKQKYVYGFETTGLKDPASTAEGIAILHHMYEDMTISQNIHFEIGMMGDRKSQAKYKEALINYYTGKEHSLCENCQKHLQNENPFPLLQCTNENCEILKQNAPKFDKSIAKASKEHYQSSLSYLDLLHIPYTENQSLISYGPYYNDIMFRTIYTDKEGNTTVLGEGGRHDDMAKKIGSNKDIPSLGFYGSMPNIVQILKQEGVKVHDKDKSHVLVISLGEPAKKEAIKLVDKLRQNGIRTIMNLGSGPLQTQLKAASMYSAPFALVMGKMEVIEGNIMLRNMNDSSQERISQSEIIPELIKRIGEENLDIDQYDNIEKREQ